MSSHRQGVRQDWLINCDELAAWVANKPMGAVPSTKSQDPKEKKLANWISQQRNKVCKQQLSAKHIKILNEVLPAYPWGTQAHGSWVRYLNQARAWIAEHGYGKKPAPGVFYRWWERNVDRLTLSSHEVDMLDDIAFPYISLDLVGQYSGWELDYEILKKWQADQYVITKTQAYPLPKKSRGVELYLHQWIKEQKKQARSRKLEIEHLQALIDRGVNVYNKPQADSPFEKQWEENFAKTREWIIEHGPYIGPSRHDEASKALAWWCFSQRKIYNSGMLSPERRERLSRIGFCFDTSLVPHPNVWEAAQNQIPQMIAFREEFGTLDFSTQATDRRFHNTAAFVQSLKYRYLNNRHDPVVLYVLQRVEGLNLFMEDPLPDDGHWLQRFNDLLDHIRSHNGIRLAPKNEPLTKWINSNKRAFRQGRLAPWKAALLVELGVSFAPPKGRIVDRATIIQERLRSNKTKIY